MAKKKGAGFQSAAGLIRYFDQEDDKALKIPPWVVVGLAIGSIIIVSLAPHFWPV
ncbi:MAG: preprotein translocase subunit Sec61beta [Thermoplasmata archaeon]|nr:preprotein translocase subunit Sec61beta [Thermoplasmata archaeon]